MSQALCCEVESLSGENKMRTETVSLNKFLHLPRSLFPKLNEMGPVLYFLGLL